MAKDAIGNDVIAENWLKTHGPGDRTLTQGLKVSLQLFSVSVLIDLQQLADVLHLTLKAIISLDCFSVISQSFFRLLFFPQQIYLATLCHFNPVTLKGKFKL